MKCQIPQISWHGRDPVLTVDFQVIQGEIRRLATGGTDAHVVIWYVTLCQKNSVSVDCACDLARHNKSVNVVRFSPNGELLASGDDEGGIFLWRLKEKSQSRVESEEEEEGNKEDWTPVKLLRGHLDDICDLNWSPNSEYIVSGSIDNCTVIWDVQKGQSVTMAKEAKGFVQGVAWDPLNQYFASISSDRSLRIYGVGSKKVLYRIHKAPWVHSDEKGLNKQSNLFHDDTLKSFSRRLTFSPDGNFLFVPSGIREKDENQIHTTYAFTRCEFGRPVFHLPSGQKYTVAVRCCPLLFKLREIKNPNSSTCLIKLPYRILIGVATQDSIFLYDTQQLAPFAYVTNIHYTHLTDISWSSDGRMIIVASTDGYCSFIIFAEGELGEIYVPEPKETNTSSVKSQDESFCLDKNTAVKISENTKLINSTEENIISSTLLNIVNSCENSPPGQLKTPKQLHPSLVRKSISVTKKSSRDITSFFSPPNKKIKKVESEDSDCSIVYSKIGNRVLSSQASESMITCADSETEVPGSVATCKQESEKIMNMASSTSAGERSTPRNTKLPPTKLFFQGDSHNNSKTDFISDIGTDPGKICFKEQDEEMDCVHSTFSIKTEPDIAPKSVQSDVAEIQILKNLDLNQTSTPDVISTEHDTKNADQSVGKCTDTENKNALIIDEAPKLTDLQESKSDSSSKDINVADAPTVFKNEGKTKRRVQLITLS